MSHELQFYIDGAWVDPVTPRTIDVNNPATEEPIGRISLGSAADVDRAATTRERRAALLERIVAAYQQAGNGREWGDYGLEEFLEVKAVMGAAA